MDQQATSQIIGREFVRQYYTVLHETPLDMHRFYTEKSSYLHGGDEQAGYELPPVCGQKVIIINNIQLISISNYINNYAYIINFNCFALDLIKFYEFMRVYELLLSFKKFVHFILI